MDTLGNFDVFLNVALIIGSIAAGALWLRSQLVKQRHEELSELAETRGHRIGDLEAKVEAQGTRITYLEGQIDAITKLKTDQIVDGVLAGIAPLIGKEV